MPSRRVAILRWTGRGSLASLEYSIGHVLQANRVKGSVRRTGGSVVVEGYDPIAVAALTQHMPGVAWIAAGLAAGSFQDLVNASEVLARRYLRRGDLFVVTAEGTGATLPSDVGGGVTSAILGAVKGARVSENPKIRFRAAFDGGRGVVGVQIMEGPGGAPTGEGQVACLVSGGRHSSVVSWMAALSGYRVKLVHARSDNESLLAVARLYSELSYRMDSSAIWLEVLTGGPTLPVLRDYASKSKLRVFGGFRSGGHAVPEDLARRVLTPLYLLPEESFSSEFVALGIKEYEKATDWNVRGRGGFKISKFGGVPADVGQVLDGLS